MASGVSSGIRRKVDDLGRVVIPAGIRRTLNIREGDSVEVSVDGERVVLAKPRDACVFCGREGDDLHSFRGRLLCRECVATIGEVDARTRAASADEDPAPADTTVDHAADVPVRHPDGHPAAVPADTPVVPARASTPSPEAATSAPRPAPGATPPTAPPSWPTGPIDGDAFARDQARQRADDEARDQARQRADEQARRDEASTSDEEHDDATADRRRRPYDPASTTAW